MSEIQSTVGTPVQANAGDNNENNVAPISVAAGETISPADVVLTAAKDPAGPVLTLMKPPAGQTEEITWVAGMAIVTNFKIDDAKVTVGDGFTIFTWADGSVLKVVGLELGAGGAAETPVTLGDGTVVGLDELANLAGIAPAAGAAAGAAPAGGAAGVGNQGHAANDTNPGDVGAGLDDTGALGYTELAFFVPELVSDLALIEEAAPPLTLSISDATVREPCDDVVKGGHFLLGDDTSNIPQILRIDLAGNVSIAVSNSEISDAVFDATGGNDSFGLDESGIAEDADGNIFFSTDGVEGGDLIFVKLAGSGDIQIVASGSDIAAVVDSEFSDPEDLVLGPDGSLYFLNDGSSEVVKISDPLGSPSLSQLVSETGFITALASEFGGEGFSLGTDTGITISADGSTLYIPFETSFFDPQDESFVDLGGVFAVDATTGAVEDIFTSPLITGPEYITLAPNGDLIVADQGSDQVYRIDPETGEVTVFISNAQLIAANNDESVDLEGGIAFDADGNFYIAEENDDNVFVFPVDNLADGTIFADDGEIFVNESAITNVTDSTADLGSDLTFVEGGGAITTGVVQTAFLGTRVPGEGGNALIDGLGGVAGFGENIVAVGDDNSTGFVDVTSIFGPGGMNFFGTFYTGFYINNNGNITFDSPLGTFTPFNLTGATGNPIIAAFFADVDTRGGDTGVSPGGTSMGTNNVYYDFDVANGVITITWDDVGYFGSHTDLENAFQLIIYSTGDGNFAFEFRYENIEWTTGDASGGSGGLGGTIARAGYNSGDGTFFELPMSGDQSAILSLETTSNEGTTQDGNWVFNVVDGQVVPTGGTIATFTVTLSGPSDVPVTVDFTTNDGTAIAGQDYVFTSGSLTFAPGETTATIDVIILGDNVDEIIENFTVELSAPVGAVISDGTGLGTILDHDTVIGVTSSTAPIEGAEGDNCVTEGDPVMFTLTASDNESGLITVQLNISEIAATGGDPEDAGTDYSNLEVVDANGDPITTIDSSGNFTIEFDSALGLTFNFFIETVDDDTYELDGEQFLIEIVGAVGIDADQERCGLVVDENAGSAVGCIDDNDPIPVLTIGDATTTEGGELVFDLTLSNPSFEDIVVDLNTASGTATDGTDYNSLDGAGPLVTFLAGSTSATVTVQSSLDSIDENTETFAVSASAVSGSVDTTDTGTGTILDDDTATLVISDATAFEGDNLIFNLSLSNPTSDDVVFTLNTADDTATEGTDFTSIDGTSVTFTAGQTSATVTVASSEDSLDEDNETFTVSATQSSGSQTVDTSDSGTGTIIDDDTATLLIGDATATEGGTLVFSLTLSNPTSGAVVFDINTASGSATDGTDYTSLAGANPLVTFTAGQTSATVTVQSTQDSIVENTETFTVSASQTSGQSVVASDTGTGTIIDDDSAALLIGDATATEGGTLVFSLTLTSALASEAVFDINTASGTAIDGTDYTSLAGANPLVTFTAGQTSATVTVQSTQDSIDEADETFTVSASQSSGALTVNTSDTGTGTILDNDTATLLIGDATATEGGTLVFDLTLSNPTSGAVVFDINTASGTAIDGTDYTSLAGANPLVTFTAGQTSATVTVQSTQDSLDESDETFTVSASQSSGQTVVATDTGTGTILDNDTATLLIGDATATEGGTLVFSLTLSNPTSGAVVFDINTASGSATDGTDYTSLAGANPLVTFTAGQTSATVTVQSTQDSIVENTETFTVSASQTSGQSVVASDTGTGTIIDDDSAALLIGDATATEGGTLVFSLTLSSALASEAVFDINTASGTAIDGTDYTSLSAAGPLVTFTAGQTSATVTVQSTQDSIDEADETFTVSASQSSGALTVNTSDTGTGTILDNDTATLLIGDATATEGGTLVFSLTLSNPTSGAVVFDINTASGTAIDGTDYTSLAGPNPLVTFTAGQTSATVTVQSTQDSIDENDETFTVSATQSSGQTVVATDTGTGTILDDDNVTLLIGDATAQEGDALVFNLTLSGPAAGAIVVDLNTASGTATDGTDYASLNAGGVGLVTFTAGQTSATITVSSTEDTIDESDETFTLSATQVSGSVITTDTGTGTILDDDRRILNGSLTTNTSVTIQLVTLSFVEAVNPLHSAAKIYHLGLQGQQGSIIQDVGFGIDPALNYQVTLEHAGGTKAIVTDFTLEGATIQGAGNAQLELNNTVAGADTTAITAVIDPGTVVAVQLKTESVDGDENVNSLTDPGAGVHYQFGADAADTLTGGTGSDVLNGGGGADTLNGDAGNDLLVYDSLDTMNGGSNGGDTDGGGTVFNANDDWDILRVDQGALALTNAGSQNQGLTVDNILDTLGAADNVVVDLRGKAITNIEIILITEEAGQSTPAVDPNDNVGTTLQLNAADVLSYADLDDTLWVLGSPGDILQLDNAGGWIDTNGGVGGIQGTVQAPDSGGVIFTLYTTAGGASLYVESEVSVTFV